MYVWGVAYCARVLLTLLLESAPTEQCICTKCLSLIWKKIIRKHYTTLNITSCILQDIFELNKQHSAGPFWSKQYHVKDFDK